MNVGDTVPELNRRIDLQTLVRYAGASGDFNPIHYDERYATAAGLPGVIGQGMLAMALVSEAVTDWVGDSGLVRQISVRFSGSYRPEDVLTISGEVVACRGGLADLQLRCVNQEGTEIVGRATATVRVPERSTDDG